MSESAPADGDHTESAVIADLRERLTRARADLDTIIESVSVGNADPGLIWLRAVRARYTLGVGLIRSAAFRRPTA